MTSLAKVTANVYGETREVELLFNPSKKYADGTQAVEMWGDEGPEGVLTVSIPGTTLGKGEYLIKTWGVNEPYRQPILDAGIFEDTGRRIRTGFVEAEIWKLVLRAGGE